MAVESTVQWFKPVSSYFSVPFQCLILVQLKITEKNCLKIQSNHDKHTAKWKNIKLQANISEIGEIVDEILNNAQLV